MIFLSYVSEDRQRVLPFYDLLESHGLDPWMDCKKILGGQNWDYEIKTALERSEIVVIFVSDNSVDKRGYAQREIKIAIDRFEDKVTGDIYIIPVQLDPGNFPALMRGIQFIKSYEVDGAQELLRSIDATSRSSKERIETAQAEAEVRWSIKEAKSAYSGIPGYSTNVNKITVSSAKYLNIVEISDHINGSLAEMSMNARLASLSPDPSLYNLMQNE